MRVCVAPGGGRWGRRGRSSAAPSAPPPPRLPRPRRWPTSMIRVMTAHSPPQHSRQPWPTSIRVMAAHSIPAAALAARRSARGPPPGVSLAWSAGPSEEESLCIVEGHKTALRCGAAQVSVYCRGPQDRLASQALGGGSPPNLVHEPSPAPVDRASRVPGLGLQDSQKRC